VKAKFKKEINDLRKNLESHHKSAVVALFSAAARARRLSQKIKTEKHNLILKELLEGHMKKHGRSVHIRTQQAEPDKEFQRINRAIDK